MWVLKLFLGKIVSATFNYGPNQNDSIVSTHKSLRISAVESTENNL